MNSAAQYILMLIISFSILFYGCNRSNSNLIESTGTVEATEVDIRTEAAGRILELYFDEGDYRKGSLVWVRDLVFIQ